MRNNKNLNPQRFIKKQQKDDKGRTEKIEEEKIITYQEPEDKNKTDEIEKEKEDE